MQHVKIFFEHHNTPENENGIESAWAIPVDKYFQLDNILFYTPEYSLGDIVSVEDRAGELFVTGLIKESGHSTVRIIFEDKRVVSSIRKHLESLGCDSEISDVPILISIDIPPEVNYSIIKEYLVEGERLSKWSFEESCIAHKI